MTRIILLLLSAPFALRLVLYAMRIIRVRHYFMRRAKCLPKGGVGVGCPRTTFLLLVPVLREQSVIARTLEHFRAMELDAIDLRVMIVGTCRELRTDGSTTLDVVGQWLNSVAGTLQTNVCFDYCEAKDEGGDRASQLNWAVRRADEIGWTNWSVVGVYDADSLPSRDSLVEAAKAFSSIPGLDACQQPARFVRAANMMARNGENPVLVANALYQDTWTVINELPMWIGYSGKSVLGRGSCRHLYFIGHGEFLSRAAYEKFQFPEGEVTDGIQLGYRLGLAGALAAPLPVFCEDDVPHNLRVLVKQHKRWFGGCMNLYSAYKSMGGHRGIRPLLQILDGLWSQARWAWTSWSFLLLLGVSAALDLVVFSILCAFGVIYSYVFPILAHLVMKADLQVRVIDWLCLPIAIFVKSIGPNMYFAERLTAKSVRYEKVER